MTFLGLSPPEVIHLFVSLACFSIGAITFAMAPRSPAHAFFAAFTMLLGGNFGAALMPHVFPGTEAFWGKAAFAFLILDPIILLYFATLFPRRREVHPTWVALGAGVVILLQAYAFVAPEDFHEYAPTPGRFLLAAYMALTYLTALALLGRNLAREESPLKREQLMLMTTAFAITLTPRLALLPLELGLSAAWGPYAWLGHAALAWGLLLALALWVRRETLAARTPVTPDFLAYAALGVGVLTLPWVVGWNVVPTYDSASALRVFLASTQFPMRWIVFLSVVGYALLKYEAFDRDLRLKPVPTAALTLLVATTALVGTYFYAQVLLDPLVLGNNVNTASAAAAAVAFVTAGVLVTAGPSALRRWRVPQTEESDASLHARRLEVYRNALEDAVNEGRSTQDDPGLASVRERLRISDAEHAAMAYVLTAPRQGRHARAPLAAGSLLFDRYKVRSLLGRGRSGRTYLATDRITRRDVAIKEIRPPPGADDTAGDETLRELAAAARVRHENVVTVHDVLQDGSGALVIMEYAPGGSLAQHLTRHAPLPRPRVLALVNDLLAGLGAVHAAGLVHRDVKPANILLFEGGRAKLTDFGVAHVPGLDETRTTFDQAAMQPGTLRYMAPEQALGTAPPTPATDVYAAGVILYECIADRPYLDLRGRNEWGVRNAIATETAALPLDCSSPELNEVLARALAKDPAARYADATAFRDALARCPEAAPQDRAPSLRVEHE